MKTRSQALAAKLNKATTREKQTTIPVDLFASLNPEQCSVVNYTGGPCRVLASAGSGKTECLARLIARLVESGTNPDRICAVTFSKKGADEMGSRIQKKFNVYGATIKTWHALCLQIMREDNLEPSTWQIEDSGPGTSPKVVLKDVLGWKGMNWQGADLAAIQNFIGNCKANLFDPDSAEAEQLAQKKFGWQAGKAVRAFQLYNEALREKGLLTFDDYLVFVAKHLESDDDVRSRWAARWDFVMQDEAQDANRAQCRIASLLARDHRNYAVIGDCFQSIYGFRGSSPEFLAEFDKEWPDAKTITLPRNYRSGRTIIDVANAIVSKARIPGLDPTPMIGERDAEGSVRVLCAESLDDEGNDIANTILRSIETGETKHADHTILFRTNAQSRALEESLLARRIPYVVVGGVSFYERKEVRDLLAYLRLAARVGTVDDIKRSINTPFRFLGQAFVGRVMDAVDVDDENIDWAAVVNDVAGQTRLQDRQRISARDWAAMVRKLQTDIDAGAAARRMIAEVEESDEHTGSVEMMKAQYAAVLKAASPAELLEHVVRTTRYIDYLNKEEGNETTADSGSANVREMVRVAERFATAAELLTYIDETINAARTQRKDSQAGGERVLLMSVHRSKGLEWPHVYVAGMNEMVLPHVKGDDQEERRLAYVAVTRARDVLTLSYVRRIATRAGVRDVAPSRYLVDTGLPLDGPKGAPVPAPQKAVVADVLEVTPE